MHEYTGRLSDHFAYRISLFSEFTRRISVYQYHLKEHEMCEGKLMEASEIINNVPMNLNENEGDVPLWGE